MVPSSSNTLVTATSDQSFKPLSEFKKKMIISFEQCHLWPIYSPNEMPPKELVIDLIQILTYMKKITISMEQLDKCVLRNELIT